MAATLQAGIIELATGIGQEVKAINTAVAGKEPAIAASNATTYFRGDKTFQPLDKAAVGLGNVNNTADSTKAVLSATKLAASVDINGVPFDGSTAITITATDSTPRIASSLIGALNGVAPLDGTGRLPAAILPASIVGALVYQGTWNPTTNTPTLVSGTGTKGWYYKVSVNGTSAAIDGNTVWQAGDQITFNGTTWDKIDGGASEVYSVAGRQGNVVLVKSDVGLANVDNTSDASKPVSTAQAAANTAVQTAAATDATTKANAAQAAAIAASTPVAHAGSTGTAHGVATTTVAGFMSAADKVKIDAVTGTNTGDQTTITGNAGTATKLQTARLIGGVSFDGTANIAIPFANLTSKPTTLAGYGITDGASTITASVINTALGYTAADAAVLATLSTNVGNTTTDFLAVFNAAKA